MIRLTYTLFIIMLLFLCQMVAFSQVLPDIKVASIEDIKPFTIEHMLRVVDKRINFQLYNTTSHSITIYGSEYGEDNEYLQPIRYLITFDEKLGNWKYPTSSNKPIDWIKESPTYKKTKMLKPGEFLNFSHDFSSEDDCDQRLKFTTNMSFGKSKQVHEVRSEEFIVSKCKDKVVENCSLQKIKIRNILKV